MKDRIVIAVDFDDTIVKRRSWSPVDVVDCDAVPWLRAVQELPGVHLILWTSRTAKNIDSAVLWLADHGLAMEVNSNDYWETRVEEQGPSRKVLADLYIDDKGLGIPLREDGVVDWARAGPMLLAWVTKRLELTE